MLDIGSRVVLISPIEIGGYKMLNVFRLYKNVLWIIGEVSKNLNILNKKQGQKRSFKANLSQK
jgi:hypothetical protein